MSLSDIMGRMDLALYPQVAMVLFMGVFVAVTWRVMRRPGSEMARHASMILDEREDAKR